MNEEQTRISFRQAVQREAKNAIRSGEAEPQGSAFRGKKKKVVNSCICCGKPTRTKWNQMCSIACKCKMRPLTCQKTNFYKKFTVNSVSGCWEWVAAMHHGGYGIFHLHAEGNIRAIRTRVTGFAHRASWILHNGPIPKGLLVCHKCDNKRCVNPDHLFIGTQKDNMHDHFLKGRRLFGSKVTNAKLNEDKVMEIRNLFKSGSNTATLGKMFGVGTGTILLIVKRKVWKHV